MTQAPPPPPTPADGYRLAPGLRWRAWDDGGVVHVEATGDTLLLDPAGTLVLEAVAGGARDAAGVRAVLAEAAPDVAADRLDAWVGDLLEQLLRDGLLARKGAAAGVGP